MMKNFGPLAIVLGALIAPHFTFAAIPPKSAPAKPQRILANRAAVSGGVAGKGFSIRDVTLASTPKKDRVVIDIGDLEGKPLRGMPGYYHAELQSNPPRLILDFSQTPSALIEEAALRNKLKKSNRIANAKMLLDPTDQTLSLILDLKKGTKAQVFQVKGEKGPGRVVVDLL